MALLADSLGFWMLKSREKPPSSAATELGATSWRVGDTIGLRHVTTPKCSDERIVRRPVRQEKGQFNAKSSSGQGTTRRSMPRQLRLHPRHRTNRRSSP